MIAASVVWVTLAGAYLLLAGQVSRNEIIAGLGASVTAAVYAAVAHRTVDAPLRLRLPWLRVILTVLRDLAVDTVRVGAALFSAKPGALSHRKPRAGEMADPGRRAVAILALSVAPNSFVVRAEDDAMLMHRLAGSDGKGSPE